MHASDCHTLPQMCVVFLFCVVTAASFDTSASAVASATSTVTVGGEAGWSPIPSDPTTYTASAGALLSFSYSGSHDVWLMPSLAAFDACDFSEATELGSRTLGGGADGQNLLEGVLTEAGTFYYACGVGTHCSRGQKIAVSVSTGAIAEASGAHDDDLIDDSGDIDSSGEVAFTVAFIALGVLLFGLAAAFFVVQLKRTRANVAGWPPACASK